MKVMAGGDKGPPMVIGVPGDVTKRITECQEKIRLVKQKTDVLLARAAKRSSTISLQPSTSSKNIRILGIEQEFLQLLSGLLLKTTDEDIKLKLIQQYNALIKGLFGDPAFVQLFQKAKTQFEDGLNSNISSALKIIDQLKTKNLIQDQDLEVFFIYLFIEQTKPIQKDSSKDLDFIDNFLEANPHIANNYDRLAKLYEKEILTPPPTTALLPATEGPKPSEKEKVLTSIDETKEHKEAQESEKGQSSEKLEPVLDKKEALEKTPEHSREKEIELEVAEVENEAEESGAESEDEGEEPESENEDEEIEEELEEDGIGVEEENHEWEENLSPIEAKKRAVKAAEKKPSLDAVFQAKVDSLLEPFMKSPTAEEIAGLLEKNENSLTGQFAKLNALMTTSIQTFTQILNEYKQAIHQALDVAKKVHLNDTQAYLDAIKRIENLQAGAKANRERLVEDTQNTIRQIMLETIATMKVLTLKSDVAYDIGKRLGEIVKDGRQKINDVKSKIQKAHPELELGEYFKGFDLMAIDINDLEGSFKKMEPNVMSMGEFLSDNTFDQLIEKTKRDLITKFKDMLFANAQEIAHMIVKVRNLEIEVARLNEFIKKLQAEKDTAVEELKAIKAQLTASDEELKSLKAALAQAKQESTEDKKKNATLVKIVGVHEATIERLKREKTDKEADVSRLEVELAKVREKEAKQNAEVKHSQEELKRLNESNHQFEAENKRLKEKMSAAPVAPPISSSTSPTTPVRKTSVSSTVLPSSATINTSPAVPRGGARATTSKPGSTTPGGGAGSQPLTRPRTLHHPTIIVPPLPPTADLLRRAQKIGEKKGDKYAGDATFKDTADWNKFMVEMHNKLDNKLAFSKALNASGQAGQNFLATYQQKVNAKKKRTMEVEKLAERAMDKTVYEGWHFQQKTSGGYALEHAGVEKVEVNKLANTAIEIMAKENIPEEVTLFMMVEQAFEAARRRGQKEIHISNCEHCPEKAIQLQEFAHGMKLRVIFDPATQNAIDITQPPLRPRI